jgi:hypothetical protein
MTAQVDSDSAQPPRDFGLDYHAARVLLLIAAFSGTGRSGIDGLTKLAKLDFLLRYPALLEQLASIRGSAVPEHIRPSRQERLAVESRMVRYKYGPWDDRYYPVVGLLLGTGLVKTIPGKGRISLSVTAAGEAHARRFSSNATWEVIARRCEFLAEQFDLTGSRLKELIYEHLPEAVDRPHRSII